MQPGYTKNCCFLCEWNNRARNKHYIKKECPKQKSYVPRVKNVFRRPVVDPNNILLPHLHIKLGLFKNFVKTTNKSGEDFNYFKQLFLKISAAKINEGIFVGPDIRKLLSDPNFVRKLNSLEKAAWLSVVEVITNFLGNKRSENYREIISNLLTYFQALGCNMSLKMHLMHSHLYFFQQT